jgi:hypothetical protein
MQYLLTLLSCYPVKNLKIDGLARMENKTGAQEQT